MRDERLFKVPGCLTLLMAIFAGFLALPGSAGGITAAGTRIPTVTSVSCEVGGQTLNFESNPATIDVVQYIAVAIAPPAEASLKPGVPITFAHTVSNRGNVADTVNLETTGYTGLTVQFFAADGVTPLKDTNGDGKIDTGVLASGAELAISVKVAATSGTKSARNEITVRATSSADPGASATLVDAAIVDNPQFLSVQTATPPGQVPPGGEILYKLDFGTDQSMAATNVVISDTLDPHLEYLEGSATLPAGLPGTTVEYNPASRLVSWRIPAVPSGYRGYVTIKTRVNPATSSDVIISNEISIAAENYPEAKTSNAVKTPVVEQPLRIIMTVSRTDAEIGELLGYTVVVENVSKTMAAAKVGIVGALPRGFRYAKGSSSVDSAPSADPSAGTTNRWELGPLGPGEKRTLAYRAIVSVDAGRGEAMSYATALGETAGGGRLISPTAATRVKIIEGLLTDRAIVLGRVFVDENGDRMPDSNERGVPNVRLYLENGYYAITDGEGKFSIFGIDAGEHVLKVDRSTLPRGSKLVPLDSSFAGDGGSRFINVPFGGMARGDFALQQLPQQGGAPKPPQGEGPPQQERLLTFGAAAVEEAPPAELEEQILTMPSTPEILQPANGAVLRNPWTDIVVRVPKESEHTLRVNGTAIPEHKIGKKIEESKRKIRICKYVGVQLEPGTNKVALEVIPADGAPQLFEIEVTAPGEPVKVEITPAKGELPADGKTLTPFTVTFLDSTNRQARGEIIYTVVSEKGEVVEPDVDAGKPGHQLKAVDGKGSFRLKSTDKTGAERIVVTAGSSMEAGAELFFMPQMREWVVTGIGSLTAGANSVSGNRENLPDDDRFKKGLDQDARLAFFAKGTFLDKYLLTAAFDSDREKRADLFQRVAPDRYYPIYGDASVQGYDAESQRKYYLKIEKERSSLLVGDFNTNLSGNEFSRYDRSFNGVKADIDTKNATLRAFGSSTDHAANRDEIAANGTSGYYFLRNTRIIENTDKIRIEVRDRYHTERVISMTEKAQYSDYSIDYRTGAILFRQPIPSYDANLNPVRIVALYESEDPGDRNYVYGGRGALRTAQGEIGITAVREGSGGDANSLYGVDALWKFTGTTAVKAEAAKSETLDKGDAVAWKAEATTKIEKAMIEAYYRKVPVKFQNLSMSVSEIGTEKYGTKVSYPLLEKTRLFGEAFVHTELFTGMKLTNTFLGASTQLGKLTLDSGVRFVRGDDGNGRMTSAAMVSAGVGGKLTDRLEGSILQEQALTTHTVRDYPSRTLLKLTYKLSERTSLFMTDEMRESGTNRGNNAVMGISHKLFDNMILTTDYRESAGSDRNRQLGSELSSKWAPAETLSITTRSGYQLQDSMTGGRGQALLGVDTSWEAVKGVRIGAKAERVQVVTGRNDPNGVNTALALSVGYLTQEKLKGTARYEFRNSPGETAHLSTVGGAWKVSDSFSLLAKGTAWSSQKPTGRDILFDGEVGGGYRPSGRNSLYLLSMVRFKVDNKASAPGAEKLKSMIGSLEFSDRLRRNLTVHGKYAGKYSWNSSYGTEVNTYSDMIVAGAGYDLTEKLDVDLSGRLMNQYGSGVSSIAAIPQLGYRIARNVRVAAGYNFAKVNDRDLSGEGYSSSGPFIQLKFKFDELSIENAYAGLFGKPERVSAPPPASPPAPQPLMATVRASLIEEPVEVVGSAEAVKLLVNDHEAELPSGDVKIAMTSVDEVLELKGSVVAPLQFQIEVSSREKITSWKIAVSTLDGQPLHTINGKGAPQANFWWDIGKDGRGWLRGGEIYQYRLELDYADGSRVTTPFRVFGVNRTSSIALSLTGGAFQTGSATLSRKAKAKLKEAAALMRSHPGEKVVIEGHSDAEEDDIELSQKRSEAAAQYLSAEERIPAGRIVVRWFGSSRPIASNAIAEGRDLNRRVEIREESGEEKRAAVIDRHRLQPFVRINQTAVEIGELGRFSSSIGGKIERLDVEMGNSDGRSIKTELPLPVVALIEPPGGAAHVACPEDLNVDGRGPLKLPHTFHGKAGAGCTLTLDGKEVAVAQDGSFSFTFELAEGEATHWLQVRNADGYSRHYRLAVSAAREMKP
jgi:uncharacterized repeat protein (TIGR01451 family)